MRRYVPVYTTPFPNVGAANDLWSADFKGTLRLGNRKNCTPLTMTDGFSRHILGIEALDRFSERRRSATPSSAHVRVPGIGELKNSASKTSARSEHVCVLRISNPRNDWSE